MDEIYTHRGGNSRWCYHEEILHEGKVSRDITTQHNSTFTLNKLGCSLTSSTSEDCWETIKAYYDRAWKIYSEKEKVRTPQERTKESLGRHFKFMKAKLSKRDTSARHLRHYFTEWEGLNISLDWWQSLISRVTIVFFQRARATVHKRWYGQLSVELEECVGTYRASIGVVDFIAVLFHSNRNHPKANLIKRWILFYRAKSHLMYLGYICLRIPSKLVSIPDIKSSVPWSVGALLVDRNDVIGNIALCHICSPHNCQLQARKTNWPMWNAQCIDHGDE